METDLRLWRCWWRFQERTEFLVDIAKRGVVDQEGFVDFSEALEDGGIGGVFASFVALIKSRRPMPGERLSFNRAPLAAHGRPHLGGSLVEIMNMTERQHFGWRVYLCPFKITLLEINAVLFGGCIVLLVFGAGIGPLSLLTIGTGLSLDNALNSASVVLVVIGPAWLRMADVYGRRRLDQPDDWVRTEIERSPAKGITVIPMLVSRAAMPPKEALPDAISGLASQQYIELRETHWRQDLQPLIDRLTAPPLAF